MPFLQSKKSLLEVLIVHAVGANPANGRGVRDGIGEAKDH